MVDVVVVDTRRFCMVIKSFKIMLYEYSSLSYARNKPTRSAGSNQTMEGVETGSRSLPHDGRRDTGRPSRRWRVVKTTKNSCLTTLRQWWVEGVTASFIA